MSRSMVSRNRNGFLRWLNRHVISSRSARCFKEKSDLAAGAVQGCGAQPCSTFFLEEYGTAEAVPFHETGRGILAFQTAGSSSLRSSARPTSCCSRKCIGPFGFAQGRLFVGILHVAKDPQPQNDIEAEVSWNRVSLVTVSAFPVSKEIVGRRYLIRDMAAP